MKSWSHERPPSELRARHAGEVIGRRDERHVELPVAHLLDEVVRTGLREVDVDERIPATESLEQGRDIHDPETLLGADVQLARQLTRRVNDGVAGGCRLGEHGARVGQEGESGVGRLDAAGRAEEQGRTELVLETADRRREARLRDPADRSRARELLLVRQGDEVLHLPKVH